MTKKNSYINSFIENDTIFVIEKDEKGEKHLIEYPIDYYFYYDDPKGDNISIFGNRVQLFTTKSKKKFQQELELLKSKGIKTYESDINPVFKCLEKNYKNSPCPELNVLFFDIEADMDPEKGYASPSDPFAKIISISFYMSWIEEIFTLVIPPKTILDENENIVREITEKDIENINNSFTNIFICENEKILLKTFLEAIQDADVISGWNSTGYDIPYLINRISLVLTKDYTRKLCFFNRLPKQRTFKKFGKEIETYDLIGRIHLDYLDLYTKHSQQQLHSYRLDYVSLIELNEQKTKYEGTLYDLYNKNFKKFIEYNRQDVHLLRMLDKKLKYIDLANRIAHENGVLIQNTLGSVALIDQAIVLEAHSRGMVVPDKKIDKNEEETDFYDDEIAEEEKEEELEHAVVGAYVANPKQGLHKWIAGCDINSLYPSIIRSFNMGPETIVGQVRQTLTNEFIQENLKKQNKKEKEKNKLFDEMFSCLEYEEIMKKSNKDLIIDFENGQTKTMKAYEIYNMIFSENSNLCLTSNATIFSYEKDGIIPLLLDRWYKERKEMQNIAKICQNIYVNGSMKLSDEDFEWLNSILDENKI
ncbi:MAG: hypothetical protein NZZ41_00255 [Candidatus Dojkabacteria bacterium]|nr:hypothetical protein [Candidatus Dojkabacteria bacterium]